MIQEQTGFTKGLRVSMSIPARWLRTTRWFIVRYPIGALGLVVMVGMLAIAILAPLIAPYDPTEASTARLAGPSWDHFFGTDNLSRDVFSRVVYGARISLRVGTIAVFVGIAAGSLVGLVSGYAGGITDLVIQRLMDVLMALPALILALVMVAMLGQDITNVMIAIAIVLVPSTARVVRAAVLSVKENVFVEAARALGASHQRIIALHILPNVLAPIMILAAAGFANAIIVEASLSFLGLGTPPPDPSWGGMLTGESRAHFTNAPWMAIFPGLALSVAVFAINMFGDALRDAWDPRLRV